MSDKDKMPTVRLHPEVQADMDADPELAAAIKKFSIDAKNAMQAVMDGRHPDFNTAMVALGYDPPEPVEDDDDVG